MYRKNNLIVHLRSFTEHSPEQDYPESVVLTKTNFEITLYFPCKRSGEEVGLRVCLHSWEGPLGKVSPK